MQWIQSATCSHEMARHRAVELFMALRNQLWLGAFEGDPLYAPGGGTRSAPWVISVVSVRWLL